MTAAKDLSLERRLRLASLIQQRYKAQPDVLRVSIKLEDLKADPLLRDLDGVQRGLRKMENDLIPDFEFGNLTHQAPQSVADTDPKQWPEVLIGYTVVLEDKAALARYILDMEQQLRETSEQYQFILADTKKHEAALSLEGSAADPYVMRTHARRYKLLRHLAEKSEPVNTQDLADFLSTETRVTSDDVRGTVEEIRTEVSEKFNIPRTSIIENDRSGTGYFVGNVRLTGATRDTL